ncbi:hypothetical protein A1353_20345 [Methylomonas methanica]|uniref:Uncharacterized protein n=1 Tax=Methylomonas methanica TaxID=421 RepID=A0A177M1V8_METMH|nr:hypothetical protein A1353_20345 [Methylomonas methanica]
MNSGKTFLHRIVEAGFLPEDDPSLRLKKIVLPVEPPYIGPAAKKINNHLAEKIENFRHLSK